MGSGGREGLALLSLGCFLICSTAGGERRSWIARAPTSSSSQGPGLRSSSTLAHGPLDDVLENDDHARYNTGI